MDNGQALRSELLSLERKVKMLLSEHKLLKGEVEQLRSENNQLKGELGNKNDELDHFQNKIKISKIVGNMVVGEDDTSDLKEVIDDYIKEIDKCIAHLGE